MDKSIFDFEEFLVDSRITDVPDGERRYDIRRISEITKAMRRPLSKEEAKKYSI